MFKTNINSIINSRDSKTDRIEKRTSYKIPSIDNLSANVATIQFHDRGDAVVINTLDGTVSKKTLAAIKSSTTTSPSSSDTTNHSIVIAELRRTPSKCILVNRSISKKICGPLRLLVRYDDTCKSDVNELTLYEFAYADKIPDNISFEFVDETTLILLISNNRRNIKSYKIIVISFNLSNNTSNMIQYDYDNIQDIFEFTKIYVIHNAAYIHYHGYYENEEGFIYVAKNNQPIIMDSNNFEFVRDIHDIRYEYIVFKNKGDDNIKRFLLSKYDALKGGYTNIEVTHWNDRIAINRDGDSITIYSIDTLETIECIEIPNDIVYLDIRGDIIITTKCITELPSGYDSAQYVSRLHKISYYSD